MINSYFCLLGLIVSVCFSQTTDEPTTTGLQCTNLGGSFVDNSATFNYDNSQYVVDIWNDAFILPLIIDDEDGSTQCMSASILPGTSMTFTCSEDGMNITKSIWDSSSSCSGSPDTEYTWTKGWSPPLSYAALQQGGIVIDTSTGVNLPVLADSGNIFDFQCDGIYAAAELEMGVACSSTVTVYGAIGAGCMMTDERQGKLMVSCDEDGAYLTTFISANSSGSWTEENVCRNELANGDFSCNHYSALEGNGCNSLLTTDGITLYGEYASCTTSIPTPSPTGNAPVTHHLFMVIFILLIGLLLQ